MKSKKYQRIVDSEKYRSTLTSLEKDLVEFVNTNYMQIPLADKIYCIGKVANVTMDVIDSFKVSKSFDVYQSGIAAISYEFFSDTYKEIMYINFYVSYDSGSFNKFVITKLNAQNDEPNSQSINDTKSAVYDDLYEQTYRTVQQFLKTLNLHDFSFNTIVYDFLTKNKHYKNIISMKGEEIISGVILSHDKLRKLVNNYDQRNLIKKEEFIEMFCSKLSSSLPEGTSPDNMIFLMKSSDDFIKNVTSFLRKNKRLKRQIKFIDDKWIKEAMDATTVSKVIDK